MSEPRPGWDDPAFPSAEHRALDRDQWVYLADNFPEDYPLLAESRAVAEERAARAADAGDKQFRLVTDLPDGGPGYTGRTDLVNRLYREGRMTEPSIDRSLPLRPPARSVRNRTSGRGTEVER